VQKKKSNNVQKKRYLEKNIKKYIQREKEHVSPEGEGVVLVEHYLTTPKEREDKKKERERARIN
jgi:hypothetical protein